MQQSEGDQATGGDQPADKGHLSAPEAVIRYAGDFLPPWAGAISIDLLPAVLIFILCIVQDVIRREDGEEMEIGDMSAADLMRAIRIQKRLEATGAGSVLAKEGDDAGLGTGPSDHGKAGSSTPAAADPESRDIVQRNDPDGPTPFPKTVSR